MTTKPNPPIINNAAETSGTDMEDWNRLKFSEKTEKPALQNDDIEWKKACPSATRGLNLPKKAKKKKRVPSNSRATVILNTRHANLLRFSKVRTLIDSLKSTRSRSDIFLPRKKKKVVESVM